MKSSSAIPSTSSSSATPSPSSIFATPSSTTPNSNSSSATPSSSTSVKKRTRYTIHDFLADNKFNIMAFGKPAKYIVNDTDDVVLQFNKFKSNSSIVYIQNTNYFDQNHDIHRMLALSNIILVDKTTNSKLLPGILSKETYRLIKQDFIQSHMLDIKFNDEKLYCSRF